MELETNSATLRQQPCPKCGYQRTSTDNAPNWQCPKCGVAYEKAASRATNNPAVKRAKQKENTFSKTKPLQRILSLLFILSCGIWTYTLINKNEFPALNTINDDLFQEPIQESTNELDFEFQYRGTDYEVVPVANYELWGLVVTHNDIDGMLDITHDEDSVDIKDICVVWGDNLKRNDFKKVEYSSGDFVCYFRYGPDVKFIHNKLSNSHLLSDNPIARERISNVHIGDQIHLTGMLVNYREKGGFPGWRHSSTTRNDTGNGACEVIFVDQFETLRFGNPLLHKLYLWMLFLIPSLLLLKFFLFARDTIHRSNARK